MLNDQKTVLLKPQGIKHSLNSQQDYESSLERNMATSIKFLNAHSTSRYTSYKKIGIFRRVQ